MKKLFFLVLLALIPSFAFAFEEEENVVLKNPAMPLLTITKTDNGKFWSLYKNQDADSVIIYRLKAKDINSLEEIISKIKQDKQEVSSIGGCPTSTIKGKAGRLKSLNNEIEFKYVCQNGTSYVNYSMSDEFVINYVTHNVKISDLEELLTIIKAKLR